MRWAEVNLDTLVGRFASGVTIDLAALQKICLAAKSVAGVRVLGRGDVTVALSVVANHFSASARQKIEQAGGKASLVSAASAA